MNVCECRDQRPASRLIFDHTSIVRVSESNPELNSMANLSTQFALGSPCLYLLGLEVQAFSWDWL